MNERVRKDLDSSVQTCSYYWLVCSDHNYLGLAQRSCAETSASSIQICVRILLFRREKINFVL